MKLFALAFALLAFAAGLRSALLWYRASRVQIMPMWERDGRIEPVEFEQAHIEWIIAILKTAEKSGRLNRAAAIWTAATIVLGTAATLIGAAQELVRKQ